MQLNRFNVRAYGVCVVDGKALMTDEIRGGKLMAKFPGGGLELGEGLEDCLIREFMEEANVKIRVKKLLYINPFLQISGMRKSDQLLSVYYEIELLEELNVTITHKPFDFPTMENNQQVFRWVEVDSLTPDDFTFPVDKALCPLLVEWFGSKGA